MTVERAAFACAAFSAAVCFAFALLDSLRWPLIHDAAIMHYIGWLVIQGKALYADIFDMNLPATHFLHYVLTRAFSDSDLAFRLCDALFLLLLAFFLGRLIWRVDRAAALWSAVAFPLYVGRRRKLCGRLARSVAIARSELNGRLRRRCGLGLAKFSRSAKVFPSWPAWVERVRPRSLRIRDSYQADRRAVVPGHRIADSAPKASIPPRLDPHLLGADSGPARLDLEHGRAG
jgi:hypothetical protein